MLKIEVNGFHKVISHFQSLPKTIESQVALAVSKATFKVLVRAKQKVSGDVLKNRTGTLRRKINARVDKVSGSIIGTVGIALSYAAAHEFGFKGSGTTTVKAHTRRSLKEAKAATRFRKLKDGTRQRYLIKSGKHGIGTGSVQVRAHQRNWRLDLPERSYLRSALRELEPEIMAELNEAIERALK